MHVTGRLLAIVMCVLFMAAGTATGILFQSKFLRELVRKHPGQIIGGILGGDPLRYWRPAVQWPGRSSLNVLVLGCDYDYDARDQIIKSSARSDSILLAHVDFANHTIEALTIPRDTAVEIPGRRGIHKINAAHAYGGPQLAMETIHSVFGVNPDCAISVSLEGFTKIIDAIGGVDVTIKKKLDYDDNWGHLHIHLKPGFQHLNGYQAMGYVRMRHSDSDFMRSERQHEFLEALRERVKQPSAFLVLSKAIDKAVDALTLTDLNMDQLLALANFSRTLPRQDITLETLPSFEGPSFVRIDVEKSEQVIRRVFFGNQQVAMAIDAPDPSRVDALNSRYDPHRARRTRGHEKDHAKTSSEENAPLPPPEESPGIDSGSSQDNGGGDTNPGGPSGSGSGSGSGSDSSPSGGNGGARGGSGSGDSGSGGGTGGVGTDGGAGTGSSGSGG